MEDFVYLLNKSFIYLYMTKAEIEVFKNNPSLKVVMDDLKVMAKELTNYNEISIGESFSPPAQRLWSSNEKECIDYITEYITTGEAFEPKLIIGFIALWMNSEIQHPIIENLVKHTLKNDLLKYPLSTTVNEYNLIKSKKPNHAPKINPFRLVDTLMVYFEIKTISGTAKRLGVDRKVVKDYLSKIVKGEVEYKVLIDENFEHYKLIQKTYCKWLAYKEDFGPHGNSKYYFRLRGDK
jgi:hypothetical protein